MNVRWYNRLRRAGGREILSSEATKPQQYIDNRQDISGEEEEKAMAKARILYYDLETAPNLAAVWGKYEQNVIWFEDEWYVMSFAYKWEGERKTHVVALPDFPLYEEDSDNDLEVVKALHDLFAEADIVIAHNGDRFDLRVINARFVFHGLTPPPPFQTIDTLKVARRYFRFNSNKLDDLGDYLGLGRKRQTGGYRLWRDCMAGDKVAWNKMKLYNKQDVRLLERVYKKLRPWMKGHPRVTPDATGRSCPKCGGWLQRRGYQRSKTMIYHRFQCQSCGGWSRERLPSKFVEKPMVTD